MQNHQLSKDQIMTKASGKPIVGNRRMASDDE